MCGYDPFYWYEYDLDKEYLERTGDNFMDGFQRALQEWERDNLYFPLDKFEAEDEDYKKYEDPEVDRRLEDRD